MLRRLLVLLPVLLGLSGFSGFQAPVAETPQGNGDIEIEPRGGANAPVSILVTDRSTGKPMPSVRLRILAEEQVSQVDLGRAGLLGQDLWARIAHFGTDMLGGEDGTAVGPGWGAGFLTVQAVYADFYEVRRLRDSPPEGLTMRLTERGNRFVRLVDGAGTPMGSGRIAVRSEVQGGLLDLSSAPVRAGQGLSLIHI